MYFVVVNDACLRNFWGLLATWLPDGKQIGREWVARNPIRADRKAGSFKINVDTGRWADFATGDAGGDPVSLYAYLNGLSQLAAARELMDHWGLGA
ncbi:MAG: hypothetical protein KJ731_08370 [Alphaproteobacteria bacterium]|nr:hypothetical protein [Alphaproteobacteria bacterium]MBU1281121.1 hypothetical protein [Alphaproteobacteria bacterium]MBU1573663.1 hypothetical protein [Alphaproteobacteria bacterium]MBU1828476.1 hypothetical protein [Alphaproteobacteria bacterium]MBU2079435.1 hypothetical protein [Alphaproteobacteria bacterium]